MRTAVRVAGQAALVFVALAAGLAVVLVVGLALKPDWLDTYAVVTTDGTMIECAESPWATHHHDDEGAEWVWCAGRPYRLNARGGVIGGPGSDLRGILVSR